MERPDFWLLKRNVDIDGVEERDIGRHTHHRSIAVLRGYIREGTVFMNNAFCAAGTDGAAR